MKIDKIKERIGYLKLWLGVTIITTISLLTWFIKNYTEVDDLRIYSCSIAIIFLLIVILILNRKIIKDIDYLEDL